ncbi:glycylpeptide N-tetradecanoyltransferase [Teratosphaeriaceae sp. CCFEE 6253]|nr:glycylpeptide N-tetradecanoyltransferase [Teratosphaeriaceae sp. CCFEE 6253]
MVEGRSTPCGALGASLNSRFSTSTTAGKLGDARGPGDEPGNPSDPLGNNDRNAREGQPGARLGLQTAGRRNEDVDDDERLARELDAVLNSRRSRPAHDPRRNCANDARPTGGCGNEDDGVFAYRPRPDYKQGRRPPGKPTSKNAAGSSPSQEQSANARINPQTSRRLLQSFAEGVRHTACAACGKPCLSTENELLSMFRPWFAGPRKSTVDISSVVDCRKRSCNARTCLGCGKLSNDPGGSSSTPGETGMTVDWCCTRGRMVLIWMLLCGFGRLHTQERRRVRESQKSRLPPKSSTSGVGFDPGYSLYGQYEAYASPLARRAASRAAGETAEDQVTGRVMVCLDSLLPSLMAEHANDFDLEPPAVLVAVLTQSSILGTIAALLRNDSLEDATMRSHLYSGTLRVVSKLASHYTTAGSTIYSTRQVQEDGADMLARSFANHNGEDCDEVEETESLASCIRNLDKQSKSILANASAHPLAFSGTDSQHMLSLCRKVSDTADLISANASPAADSPSKGKVTCSKADDWQAELAVLELPDQEILSQHYYGQEALRAYNSAPGRMKSLSLQLSTLMTSLPPGIFVRHCASRLDIMKVLIVGPRGTPYENGLFEFDLFCPSNFPNEPPKMTFRTTGSGWVEFNPNLYANGKVCLSLLGTWSGEPWQPGKSTILQILVSIQAMIFCDEPWYNEPDRGKDQVGSLTYNWRLQGYTVYWAMMDWLCRAAVGSVWEDVVLRHFATNAEAIERTVDNWKVDEGTKARLSHALGKVSGRLI